MGDLTLMMCLICLKTRQIVTHDALFANASFLFQGALSYRFSVLKSCQFSIFSEFSFYDFPLFTLLFWVQTHMFQRARALVGTKRATGSRDASL